MHDGNWLQLYYWLVLGLLVGASGITFVLGLVFLVFITLKDPDQKELARTSLKLGVVGLAGLAILYFVPEPFVYTGMIVSTVIIVWVVIKVGFVLAGKPGLWNLDLVSNWLQSRKRRKDV